jgi:hypothetical protein
VLSIPDTYELKVDAARAVRILEDRTREGETLLRTEWVEATSLPPFRRAVRRWQEENETIVASLLIDSGRALSATLSARPEADLTEVGEFEALKDEVARDQSRLSALIYRIRIEENLPERAAVDAPQPDWVSTYPEPPPDAPEPEVAPEEEPPPDSPALADDEDAERPEDGTGPAEAPADERIAVAAAASAALPEYDADAVTPRDLVGIERVVDAFSYLIAARAMQPPLAVGLFGEWGSGKTFLMRAVQRRIDQITRGARESERPPAELGVHERIVQIEFNAWHYVEGNLWASLVDHIFSNLRTSFLENPQALENRRRTITKQLASTQHGRALLNERIEALDRRRKDKIAAMKGLQATQKDRLEKVQRLRLGDVAAAATLQPEDKQALKDALDRVGVPGVDEAAADASHSLESARDVVIRGSTLLGPMRQRPLLWVLALVLVAAVAPATSLLLDSLDLSALTQVLSSLGALLGAFAVVASVATKWASRSLTAIGNAEARVRRRVEAEAKQQAAAIASAQQEVDDAEHELEAARQERLAAEAEIDELRGKLADLTPGRVLAEFLDQRTSSSDYRKHLGLTAIVRRDFEELSRLVALNNDDRLRGKPHSDTNFNRVVLYVDDLDRCPPRRVVEVLQAVHLLLSFPVFVVVVAVDPRWLAQSLNSEYRDLLGLAEGGPSHATPDDYLEKIFQIPFRVAPLDIAARGRFVEGLLGADVAGPPALASAPPAAEAEAPERDEPAAPAEPEPVPEAGPPAESEDLATPAPVVSLIPADSVDLNPASLRFTAAEAGFLETLLPLLEASPRSIKRYVNIYRLIKSVADMDGTPGEGDQPAPFEAAMLLLAVQTGLPVLGPGLVERVAGADPAVRLGALVAELRDTGPERTALEQWLATRPAAREWTLGSLAEHARHVRMYSFS